MSRIDLGLAGRVAVITGASSGIGAACAHLLGEHGAHIVACGRDVDRLSGVAATIPTNVEIVVEDLATAGAPDRIAAAAHARFDNVDFLINCAGHGLTRASKNLDEEALDAIWFVNVRVPIRLSGLLASSMTKGGAGAIVNVSSVVGALGTPYQASYAATKGAVEAMTRSMAREYGPRGLRVNCVRPGLIVSEMWRERLHVPGLIEGAAAGTALRRWGSVNEVSEVIVFLLSGPARYITGEIVTVDGGLVSTGDLIPETFFRPPDQPTSARESS